MARIRTIKPEFFVSEQIADVSPTGRLLFIGMWLFCDDAGIHPASPRQLKMEVFPGDDITTKQVASLVAELLRVGLLIEYEAQGQTYWHVTGWHHQKIERPRYQYPKPDSPTARRHVADTSATPRSPRVRAVPETTVPETTGDEPKREDHGLSSSSFPDPLNGDAAFAVAWNSWVVHRRQIKKPLTGEQTKKQLATFAEWGVARSIAAIEHTIRQGWQGLREPEGSNGHAVAKKPSMGALLKGMTDGDET